MRLKSLATAALLASLPVAALADMQPGQYRTVVTSDIKDDKPQDQAHCVTQKDIDSGLTEMGVQKDSQCKVKDFRKTSSTVSYRVDCGQAMGGLGQQKVDGTFSNDAFDLKMQIQIEPQGKPNTIHMVGKRIGACKEK